VQSGVYLPSIDEQAVNMKSDTTNTICCFAVMLFPYSAKPGTVHAARNASSAERYS
jgi:hypothetical protein